jgi:hypothetical protein
VTAAPEPSDAPVVTGPTPEPVRCYPPTFTDDSFICDCQNDCIESPDLICNCEEAVECCNAYGDTPAPASATTQSPTNDNSGKCLISVTTSQCDTLMNDFTRQGDCDCYNFCNGVEIPCCPFGNDCNIDCEGELAAGCLEPDPTPEPTPVPFVGDSCQVSVNTQNCQAIFPVDLPPVQGCDCYNFCGGQYFSCCTAGQPCGMQCEGNVVAGCAFKRPDDTFAPTAVPGPSTYFFWPNGFI